MQPCHHICFYMFCDVLGRLVAKAIARSGGGGGWKLGDCPFHVWEGAIFPSSI